MHSHHDQEVRDAQAQNNVAAILGAIIVVSGLFTSIVGNSLIGILIAIFGVLVYMAMSINSGLAQISLNQCVIIDLQNELIRTIRNNDD
ncbi:hypothetical protein DFR30_0200 [Thiogranum longum]|uniref:Uncharacterized protein n=1 Tax=Thiogranum longum TaxID=1537524 RepID=A0A4R1HA29_9GAMM|nr:hypothetical protein DFR30_0200 [Thiogranum longum]